MHLSERSEAVRLLERLDEAEDVVVVSPRNDPPDWVPAELRGTVRSPAAAKGLEYQSVCVLDPGRLRSTLAPENMPYGIDADIEQPARRTSIDHLRVTLSRATETLVSTASLRECRGRDVIRMAGAVIADREDPQLATPCPLYVKPTPADPRMWSVAPTSTRRHARCWRSTSHGHFRRWSLVEQSYDPAVRLA